ncbi:MAG: hypothetical protein HeimC3_07140 [Candidatus Heimdallarchaeota archaeon LC_3]|nr:MAG: hypothetical protein HeimC3_07140 [Candidatus Heimdallarchaeota archaeon LC_3]
MDTKIKSGLLKLNKSSGPVLLKDLGITKTLANTLEKIGLIELQIILTGSKPVKVPNSAIITDFGKNLIFLSDNPDITSEISYQRTFKNFFQSVENAYMDLKEITATRSSKERKSNFFLTENLVLREIDSYKTAMKSVAEIPTLVNGLVEKTKLPKEKIHSYIYQLHLSKKVLLHSGEKLQGDPLVTNDGSKFYFVK